MARARQCAKNSHARFEGASYGSIVASFRCLEQSSVSLQQTLGPVSDMLVWCDTQCSQESRDHTRCLSRLCIAKTMVCRTNQSDVARERKRIMVKEPQGTTKNLRVQYLTVLTLFATLQPIGLEFQGSPCCSTAHYGMRHDLLVFVTSAFCCYIVQMKKTTYC